MAERKIWFITRPERDPKFHKEALEALSVATDNFSVIWKGNRDVHKKYEKVLAKMGLKRNSISNDGSGGRTWAAMLRTFCYCYMDDNKKLVLTKAGEQILKGNKVFDNIKKQILTLQIPNAYFLSSGFRPKYESDFSIRPARFLIKVCAQKDLDYYLTKEEITYFVITAKSDNQIKEITQKIIQFRKASSEQKEKIKYEITEAFDHRERSDKGARNFEAAHSDVAHTFMLIADYTGLAEYIRGQALRINSSEVENVNKEISYYDDRYPLNKRYLISLERMAENNGLDIDSYKANNFKNIKPASNLKKSIMKAKRLLEGYPQAASLSFDDITNILKSEFSERDAKRIADHIQEELKLSSLNENFIEGYLHENDNLVFEDKTGQIFKALGFDVVMRPKHSEKEGTEIEILVKYGENECGIIDSKNYKKKFTLSANLASHMALEYIRTYDRYDNRKIKFFGYVTASNIGGEKNLEKISKLTKEHVVNRDIPGFMINAKTLLGFLDYCLENQLPKEQRIQLFLKLIDNSAYTSFHMLKEKLAIKEQELR
jgi:ribosomal silencing factor RsfS